MDLLGAHDIGFPQVAHFDQGHQLSVGYLERFSLQSTARPSVRFLSAGELVRSLDPPEAETPTGDDLKRDTT
jgi:hypothetical protein